MIWGLGTCIHDARFWCLNLTPWTIPISGCKTWSLSTWLNVIVKSMIYQPVFIHWIGFAPDIVVWKRRVQYFEVCVVHMLKYEAGCARVCVSNHIHELDEIWAAIQILKNLYLTLDLHAINYEMMHPPAHHQTLGITEHRSRHALTKPYE